MTAVIMPGTILGDGAVLGAIAAADIGQELGSNALFMGVPAMSTSKHTTGGPLPPSNPPIPLFNQGFTLLSWTAQVYRLAWPLPLLSPTAVLWGSAEHAPGTHRHPTK